MKHNHIYISGPITSDNPAQQQVNIDLFYKAEKHLKSIGFKKIINPAKLRKQKSWTEYMRKDLVKMLQKCDRIYMLRGWQKSKGAKVEIKLAMDLDFEIDMQ